MLVTILFQSSFSIIFTTKSVSADTIEHTSSQSVSTPSDIDISPNSSPYPHYDTGNYGSVNVWEYKYTAQPYAFFQHKLNGQWKMLQVTSYTQHTINVMFNG